MHYCAVQSIKKGCAMTPPPDGSWGSVNVRELLSIIVLNTCLGLVRLMYAVRRGRAFRWLDVLLEPSLAVVAGMLIWALTEYTAVPDLMQTVLTSLGAWGGPKTIQYLETKYLGALPGTETKPGDLDNLKG